MNPKDFDALRESIKEASEIMHGLRPPARETLYEVPEIMPNRQTVFAICLQTDDEATLTRRKVYEIGLRGEYARVVDETGEATIYPLSYFLLLDLPNEAAATLRQVA